MIGGVYARLQSSSRPRRGLERNPELGGRDRSAFRAEHEGWKRVRFRGGYRRHDSRDLSRFIAITGRGQLVKLSRAKYNYSDIGRDWRIGDLSSLRLYSSDSSLSACASGNREGLIAIRNDRRFWNDRGEMNDDRATIKLEREWNNDACIFSRVSSSDETNFMISM